MGQNRTPADPALTDRGWRGYDPRAAAPQVAAATVASAVLLAGRWELGDLSAFANRAGALVVYAVVLAVWPGLLAVALYRAVTYTYRLTDRALLVDRGFMARPEPPVWLADVTGVVSGAGWVGQRLGVGWVRVATADGRAVRLTGVRDPGAYAIQLREAVEKAKGQGARVDSTRGEQDPRRTL
jgi:uncharacterized membrane protein YdbT with pleckstrin-like domain